ncbi:hypothetical protein QTP70_028792, partial [Hemibagrus guttatus]
GLILLELDLITVYRACVQETKAIALEVTEMEKKRSKWKRQHSEDSEDNMVADRALRSLGICGTAWNWFASYLDGRSYQLYPQSYIFSFPPSDATSSARISACLADISSWMTAHQLKPNPSKTELLIIPGDLAISLSNSMISPSATARNLGVTMDNQLSFSSHVTNVTRSCQFLLYNIRRIRPFLSTQATQVLVQSLVISRLDYCNSLLAGLPLNAIRPLQMIQNAAARLVFNLPKFSHTTPLLRSLHWLPVAARIRFKTLMLAYKAKNGPAPSYLKALVTPRTAPRSLRSTSTARLVPPSLREKGRTTSTIEEEDHTEGPLKRSSFKNHSKTFHKHFQDISETDDLIHAFTCALQKEVLYHGKMYVSLQHVCFYSSVLLKETKVQIHVSDIQIIKKKNTARVVPNAISIVTRTGDKYLFGSLRNRDVCFKVLKSICPQLQDVSSNGCSQMSSAENVHELEADTYSEDFCLQISSHSSQEDSTDLKVRSDSEHNRTTGHNVPFSSSVSNTSHVKARNNSTSWNSTSRDGSASEENTAVSWVAMVTEKIKYFLSFGGTTSINRLITVYLILALLLLLSSGYIGLRIAALEEQLSTLGSATDLGLQKSYKET